MPFLAEASSYQERRPEAEPTRPLLRLVDNHGFAPDFRYGQSIFIIEGFTVTELKVYNFDREKVYAVRWNGVRTSVTREKVIFIDERAAYAALQRMKGANQ